MFPLQCSVLKFVTQCPVTWSAYWVFHKGQWLVPYYLYINDLLQQCHDIELQMYADDTVQNKIIWVSNCQANSCVGEDHTLAWSVMSESKCLQDKGYVFFSKTMVQPPKPDILIKGERTDIVADLNILVWYLIKKKSTTFRHIRKCLSLDFAKMFMHAMILSHISYCKHVAGRLLEQP